MLSPIAIQRVAMATAAVIAAILILSLHLLFASRFTATAQIALENGGQAIAVERLESLVAAPAMIGGTVDKLGLAGPINVDRWTRRATRERAIERIWSGLKVEQTDLTNVFALRYTGASRVTAAPIVNDLAGRIISIGAGPESMRGRIVFPASEPAAPDGSLLVPITLALLCGALAAVVTLGVREWRQEGPRTPATAERALGLPVLGMIPIVPGIPMGERATLTGLPAIAPHSAYTRAFRRVLFSAQPMARTIAVCSALAGEGKSTFAISLARTGALEGLRVAFLDCDGRMRAASVALNVQSHPGLVQVMDRLVTLEDALIPDPLSPLMILGHSSDAEIRDLWARDAMAGLREITRALADDFDLVVIDTPPLLALVEAREIAGLADEALLIARWRATPLAALRLAIRLLDGKHLKTSLVLSFVRFAEHERPGRGVSVLSRRGPGEATFAG